MINDLRMLIIEWVKVNDHGASPGDARAAMSLFVDEAIANERNLSRRPDRS